MKSTYDPLADAVSVTFKKGKVVETKEVSPGVLLDLDKSGTPLYLEILDASKRFKKTKHEFKDIILTPFKYSKSEIVKLHA